MSLYKVQLFLCLVFFLAVAACALPASGTTSLTAKDAGSTIQIKQGDIVQVALNGNPTTGFTWEALPGSEGLVQQGEAEFKPDSNALGSGGNMTLQFKAVRPGTTVLKLIYHRPFEPNVPPLQSFEVTVVVEP